MEYNNNVLMIYSIYFNANRTAFALVYIVIRILKQITYNLLYCTPKTKRKTKEDLERGCTSGLPLIVVNGGR